MDEEGLGLIKYPCVLQQYYNHGAKFYKVYVIGDEVMVHPRSSLPDLPRLTSPSSSDGDGDDRGGSRGRPGCWARQLRSLEFDSRHPYPTLDDFFPTGPSSAVDSDAAVNPPQPPSRLDGMVGAGTMPLGTAECACPPQAQAHGAGLEQGLLGKDRLL